MLISADRRKLERSFVSYTGHDTSFCQPGSVDCERYCSLYLEMMRHLLEEHPSIYKEFMEGKFVVKASAGFFNPVTPVMKLEPSIQRSKKDAGGVIGQTKQCFSD